MKKGTGILLIVSFLVLALIIVVVKSYSSLSTLNTDVSNKESDLNVQLSRKKEQVSNLINKLKEKDETIDLNKINDSLDKLKDSDIKVKGENNELLTKMLNELFSNIDQEIINNEEIKTIIKDILSTEKRIETAVNNYNQVIDDYNSKVNGFPSSIIASVRGFKVKERFEISTKLVDIFDTE